MAASITAHVATLLYSSLDQPRPGKSNPNKAEYFALLAFPPTAGNDLAAAMQAVAPNGNLGGQRLTVERNDRKAKPHEGIPGDWLIVRMASGPDYPPDLFGEGGQKIPALPLHGADIRTHFYAGQRVRVNAYPYTWNHAQSGARGISWNLSGLMAVGGGERRAGGNAGPDSETAFGEYLGANPPAAQQTASQPQQSAPPAAAGGNPFAQNANDGASPF